MTLNHEFESESDPLPNSRVGLRQNTTVPQTLNPHIFMQLLFDGMIVDGRSGGLVLGRSYDEGGIRTVFKFGSEYLLQGLLEGGCFLVNKRAAVIHSHRLQMMNAGLTMRETASADDADGYSQLLATNASPHDRLLWIDWNQTFVSREPAMKHLAELADMNLAPNPYFRCDHYELFNCEPGPADGVV